MDHIGRCLGTQEEKVRSQGLPAESNCGTLINKSAPPETGAVHSSFKWKPFPDPDVRVSSLRRQSMSLNRHKSAKQVYLRAQSQRPQSVCGRIFTNAWVISETPASQKKSLEQNVSETTTGNISHNRPTLKRMAAFDRKGFPLQKSHKLIIMPMKHVAFNSGMQDKHPRETPSRIKYPLAVSPRPTLYSLGIGIKKPEPGVQAPKCRKKLVNFNKKGHLLSRAIEECTKTRQLKYGISALASYGAKTVQELVRCTVTKNSLLNRKMDSDDISATCSHIQTRKTNTLSSPKCLHDAGASKSDTTVCKPQTENTSTTNQSRRKGLKSLPIKKRVTSSMSFRKMKSCKTELIRKTNRPSCLTIQQSDKQVVPSDINKYVRMSKPDECLAARHQPSTYKLTSKCSKTTQFDADLDETKDKERNKTPFFTSSKLDIKDRISTKNCLFWKDYDQPLSKRHQDAQTMAEEESRECLIKEEMTEKATSTITDLAHQDLCKPNNATNSRLKKISKSTHKLYTAENKVKRPFKIQSFKDMITEVDRLEPYRPSDKNHEPITRKEKIAEKHQEIVLNNDDSDYILPVLCCSFQRRSNNFPEDRPKDLKCHQVIVSLEQGIDLFKQIMEQCTSGQKFCDIDFVFSQWGNAETLCEPNSLENYRYQLGIDSCFQLSPLIKVNTGKSSDSSSTSQVSSAPEVSVECPFEQGKHLDLPVVDVMKTRQIRSVPLKPILLSEACRTLNNTDTLMLKSPESKKSNLTSIWASVAETFVALFPSLREKQKLVIENFKSDNSENEICTEENKISVFQQKGQVVKSEYDDRMNRLNPISIRRNVFEKKDFCRKNSIIKKDQPLSHISASEEKLLEKIKSGSETIPARLSLGISSRTFPKARLMHKTSNMIFSSAVDKKDVMNVRMSRDARYTVCATRNCRTSFDKGSGHQNQIVEVKNVIKKRQTANVHKAEYCTDNSGGIELAKVCQKKTAEKITNVCSLNRCNGQSDFKQEHTNAPNQVKRNKSKINMPLKTLPKQALCRDDYTGTDNCKAPFVSVLQQSGDHKYSHDQCMVFGTSYENCPDPSLDLQEQNSLEPSITKMIGFGPQLKQFPHLVWTLRCPSSSQQNSIQNIISAFSGCSPEKHTEAKVIKEDVATEIDETSNKSQIHTISDTVDNCKRKESIDTAGPERLSEMEVKEFLNEKYSLELIVGKDKLNKDRTCVNIYVAAEKDCRHSTKNVCSIISMTNTSKALDEVSYSRILNLSPKSPPTSSPVLPEKNDLNQDSLQLYASPRMSPTLSKTGSFRRTVEKVTTIDFSENVVEQNVAALYDIGCEVEQAVHGNNTTSSPMHAHRIYPGGRASNEFNLSYQESVAISNPRAKTCDIDDVKYVAQHLESETATLNKKYQVGLNEPGCSRRVLCLQGEETIVEERALNPDSNALCAKSYRAVTGPAAADSGADFANVLPGNHTRSPQADGFKGRLSLDDFEKSSGDRV